MKRERSREGAERREREEWTEWMIPEANYNGRHNKSLNIYLSFLFDCYECFFFLSIFIFFVCELLCFLSRLSSLLSSILSVLAILSIVCLCVRICVLLFHCSRIYLFIIFMFQFQCMLCFFPSSSSFCSSVLFVHSTYSIFPSVFSAIVEIFFIWCSFILHLFYSVLVCSI